MRYYQIVISDPTTRQIWQPTSTGALVKSGVTTAPSSSPPLQGGVSTDAASGLQAVTVLGRRPSSQAKYTFSSHPQGVTAPPDPGALNVEFDLAVTPEDTPQGGALIRVHGVGLQMISQAANLTGQAIALYAGMGKGLPLADPSQSGLIMQGQIFQSFGNWTGTDQSLDLICNPGGRQPDSGVMFDWQPGTTLATALAATFAQAFPQYQGSIDIIDLQPPKNHAQQGCYRNLTSFSRFLQDLTQPLGAATTGNASYPGVRIAIRGSTIVAYDAPTGTKQLNFQDFVGQPTWISAAAITFQTVLRADIQVGDVVKFPQGIVAPFALTAPTAAVPNAPARSKLAFQGSFHVLEVHHFANFCQPDAMAWNTTFTAASDFFVPDVSLLGAFPAL